MNGANKDIKYFCSLSEAVVFIAECIGNNSASELMAQLAHVGRPTTMIDYPAYFAQRIFPQLKQRHQEIDFRVRYKDQSFSVDDVRFKLGGHMKELGYIHIDFMKTDQGWVLDDIWECR